MAAVFAAKQKKFAILGAGRLGQSTAAHFAMNGLETALWDPETERIEAIRSKGNTIKLSGVVEGEGRLSAVSSSLQEVAESSEVLIMCAGGFAQEEFARQLCPHLKPWHHVILFPGDTFGALSVRQIFDVYDASYAQITVSETSSALFTCNLVENGTCEIKAVKTNIPFATIPASRTAEVLDCLRPYYTQFAPVQSVLETSLNNMHAVANPVVALMNAARAESGQAFRLFREGVTPAVAAVMDRVDQERRALCGAAGVQGVPLAAWLHEAYDLPLESLDRMYRGAGQYDDVGQGAALAFIHEDICAGLVPMASLGQLLGVPTPTMDGLLQLARAAFPELQERLAAGRRVRTVRSVGLCMAQVPGSSSASARRERLDRYLLTGDRDDLGKEQVLVVGSGAVAHVLAGLLAAREDLAVSVWAPDPKDARRWQDELEADGRLRVVAPNGRVTVGRPRCVSADPAAVAPAASKVLLALPGAAQPAALAVLAPHLAEGAWLGCLGGPGAAFEWEAGRVVGEHAGRFTVAPAGDVFTEKVVLFGVAASPWLARVAKFACEVRVVGRQSAALVGVVPAARGAEVAAWLGAKLGDGGGVRWEAAGHALAVTLAPVHQVIVPGLLYARFKDWGGEAFDEIPLLYSGTTHEEAAVVEKLGEECNAVAARLEAALGVPLPEARAPLLEALCRRCFPEAVEDDATLRAALLSNRAWAHTRTPMRCAPEGGGFVPDLAGPGGALAEAAAGGLAALKGLAELAGAETPTLDQVLEWCQAQVGKEYLVGGGGSGGGGAGGALRLLGRDALSARVPARYGLGDLDALRRRVAP